VSEVTGLSFVLNHGGDVNCWMSLIELIHPQSSHQVSVVPFIKRCNLVKNNPSLTISLYRVQSALSLDKFRDFVSALEDQPIDIKDRN
jgi:hypothetical protein